MYCSVLLKYILSSKENRISARVIVYSALGNLPPLGWGRRLSRDSRCKAQGRLNPRWHCLSLAGTFLAGLREPRQPTHPSSHGLYTRVHVATLATLHESRGPPRLPCPSTALPGRAAAPLSGTPSHLHIPVLPPPSAWVRVWHGDNRSAATRPECRDLLLESGLITAFRSKYQGECLPLQSQRINSQTGFFK